jgi:predicted protein tyrosine phosphatase
MQKLWCTGFKGFQDLVKINNWTENVPNTIAIISINSRIPTDGETHLCNGDNVLNLDFDDIDPTSIGLPDTTEEYSFTDGKKVYFFTAAMAKETIDFIEKHKEKNFFIHCSAGLSRSQAFVKYIKNVYFDNDWETNPGNPCLYANGFVYQKLMHAYRCREENFNLFDRFS